MASAGGSTLKDLTMELGGKSPLIVFDDAELQRAADIAMTANFFSSGQVCTQTAAIAEARASAPSSSKIRLRNTSAAGVLGVRR